MITPVLLLGPRAAQDQDALGRAGGRGRVEHGVVAPDAGGRRVVEVAARAAAAPRASDLLAVPEVDDGAAVGQAPAAPVFQEPDVVLELAVAGVGSGFRRRSHGEGGVD